MKLNTIIKLAAVCLLLTTSLHAMADRGGSSYDDAIEISFDSNTCLFKQGDTYESIHHYTYTATKSGILSVTGNTSVGFYAVDASGNELTAISGAGSCMVPMKEGQKMFLQVSPNVPVVEQDVDIYFYCKFQENDNAGKGTSADDPIVIEENVMNITIKPARDADSFNSYFTYTATEDAVLSLASTAYLSVKKYGDTFAALDHDFVSDYVDGQYVGKIPVTAGKTVCIMISTYSPSAVVCNLVHPTRGTIDYPFDAAIGSNSVPGEYGNYYFLYSGTERNGYLKIESQQTLPRGYVEVYTMNNLYTPIARSESGAYDMRFPATSRTPYLIHVFKAEESEDVDDDDNPLPDTFTMTFEELAAGDTPENPIVIATNTTVQTTSYTGTYYFMVNVPDNASGKVLDVMLGGVKNPFTQVYLYNRSLGAYYSVKDNSEVKMVVEPGQSYIIAITKEDSEPYSLTVNLRDIIEGESIVKPIAAVKGNNQIAKAKDVYYTYVATLTGRMTITFDIPGISAEFPISTSASDGSYVPTVAGTSYYLDVAEGVTYYMHFSNITEASAFSLDEHEYAEGEAIATAIPVSGNAITMPGGQASVWYSYTAPISGKMEIASEADFYGDGSTIIYYCTKDDQSRYFLNTSDTDGNIVYYASRSVGQGDVIYIHITTSGNFGGKKLLCSVREFAEGETIDNPYLLSSSKPLITDIPMASRTQSRWIKVDMAGMSQVEIKTDRYSSGGIYESTDLTHGMVKTFVPDYNNEICTLRYANDNKLDVVYLCLEMTGGIININATFTPADGIETITLDAECNTATYNLSGQRVGRDAKGIIVKNGKKYITK